MAGVTDHSMFLCMCFVGTGSCGCVGRGACQSGGTANGCCNRRETVTVCTASGKRSVGVVVKMAFITDRWVTAGMFGREQTTGEWYRMTRLADTVTISIFVFSPAGGIAEEYLGRLPGIRDGAPDQIGIGSLAGGRVIRVILHMGPVTINTLDILTLHIVILFTGMTVSADIHLVGLTAEHRGPAAVGPQQIPVSCAQIGKIGTAINGTAARIGEMNPVTG